MSKPVGRKDTRLSQPDKAAYLNRVRRQADQGYGIEAMGLALHFDAMNEVLEALGTMGSELRHLSTVVDLQNIEREDRIQDLKTRAKVNNGSTKRARTT